MSKADDRKLISDPMWEKLEGAVKLAKHSAAGAPPAMTDREFLEAILYLNRTGCPWRDLPAELGYWHAVYMRFRRWGQRGVSRRLWQQLPSEPFAPPSHLFIPPTTLPPHPPPPHSHKQPPPPPPSP